MSESQKRRSESAPSGGQTERVGDGGAADDFAPPGSRRRHLLLVLLMTAVSAVIAVAFPLAGDEVYYWDCARHLDWSYFDQPPLAIWIIAAARPLLGDSQLAARMPALLSGFVIGWWLLPPLVRRLGGRLEHASRAWLWMHVLPLFALGLSYTSTDVVMAAAYVGATWAAVAVAQGERRAWWGLGVALGLGFLAKFSIVVAFLPVFVMLLSPRARADLRTPVPWLAALLSLALTAPVWIWALRNQGDNLLFQLSWRHSGGAFRVKYLLEFLSANLGVASPVLAVLLVWALARAWKRPEIGWRVASAAALAPFLFFGFVSLRTRVGAHWGAPGLVILVALFVLVGVGGRRLRIAAATVGIVLSLSLIAILAVPSALADFDWAYEERPNKIRTSKLARIVGTEELARALEERRVQWAEELGIPLDAVLVASESYSLVHLMAFYSGGDLPTRLLRLTAGQHGLASLYWYEPEDFADHYFLVVTQKDDWRLPLLEEEIRGHFGRVEKRSPIVVDVGELGERTLQVWRCEEPLEPATMFTRAAVRAEQAF